MFSIKYQTDYNNSNEYYMYFAHTYSVRELKDKDMTVIHVWPEKGSDPFDIFIEPHQTAYIMNQNGQTIDIVRGPHDAVVSAGRIFQKKEM